MKNHVIIEATLWFTDENNRTRIITRTFENRAHLLRVAELTENDKGWRFDHYHIMRVVGVESILEEEEEEEEEEERECEFCCGTGEIGPYGHEYPEYDVCSNCRGTGKEDFNFDPDHKMDARRELL